MDRGLVTRAAEGSFGQVPMDFYVDASKYSSGGILRGDPRNNWNRRCFSGHRGYVEPHSGMEMESAHLTTDDCRGFINMVQVCRLLSLSCQFFVALTRLLIRKTGAAGQVINWHFFFLGAGFLLLEAQIVSRMAMLFGRTWLVNSIVIAAILVLIVAVNFLVDSGD